ncbi:hypothetical protein DKX38_016812 [Salix brachista]|uniref:Uncharacterized protein n=1 Tax=Salix brachista TaxID=2182728 RepID=A0A5N5KUP8_9ROSI|nr:hypothetical protein DKX38_016812 [Salix brachista]
MNNEYYDNRLGGPEQKTALKMVVVIMGFCLVGYIVGPPLYWRLSELLTANIRSSTHRCPPCSCDCSSQQLLSLLDGVKICGGALILPPKVMLFVFDYVVIGIKFAHLGPEFSDLMIQLKYSEAQLVFMYVNFLKQFQNMNLEIEQQILYRLVYLLLNCMKHDPEVSREMEQSSTNMLKDELRLSEEEAQKKQQRADLALLEAKRMTSQYQKEAEKCNYGMDSCEEAREKAEDVLEEQRKLTAIWELRARERGWREGIMRSHANQNLE